MTRQSIACLMVVCACSVDPEEGMPFTGGADGGVSATAENEGDDTGGTEESSGDESGSADADADPSTTQSADESTGDASATITTTDATTEPSTDTAGSSDDGASSLDDSGDDGANEDDAYQACESNNECTSDPGLACLTAENGGEGFCSPSCGTMGQSPPDPQLCPPAPDGVTATVVCLEGFLIRNCALSCAGGLTCPEGTECLPANNGGGPYCFGSGA